VKGTINDVEVVVLVDFRATTNFISRKLTRLLNLEVQNTLEFEVEVGMGEKVKNRGICPQLRLEVLRITIQQRFFLMELGGSDVALRLEWLAGFGEVRANFKNLKLAWGHGREKKKLSGDPSLCKSQTSRKALLKALEEEGFIFSYQVLEAIQ